VVKLSGK